MQPCDLFFRLARTPLLREEQAMNPDPKDGSLSETGAVSPGTDDTVRQAMSDRALEPVHLSLSLNAASADRYQVLRELGRGGMGEVHLCLDRRIGREVALKRCTLEERGTAGAGAGVTDRFLREICVQGQLEHPTVVPLHDLSVGSDGEIYFTMKHVRGRTLRSILAALLKNDAGTSDRFPLRKLLGSFANVCLGVAFAHSRGVIHRDLKPDNVMLGEFGEVYILDWGVAKVVGVPDAGRAWGDADQGGADRGPDAPRPAVAADHLQASASGMPKDGETAPGSIIGTPGYMPPEQCVTRMGEVDERADVYSLGAILFEILAGKPLHDGDAVTRLQSTLTGADARISVRAPDREPFPELEAACVKATASRPENRCSARELNDVVERYLSHDRDLELRRGLAAKHAAAAAVAAEKALSSPSMGDEERRGGLADAGRALALDPDNRDAMRIILRLLTTPPRSTPAEVEKELDTRLKEFRRAQGRFTALGILALMLVFPLYLWMGVVDWTWFLLFAAASAAFGLFQLVIARAKLTGDAGQLISMSLGTLAMCGFAATSGPLLLVPGFAALLTLGHALHVDRHRLVIFALGCVPIVVPSALQALGVLPVSYSFDDHGMTILPRVILMRPESTLPVLFVSALLLVAVAAMGGAQARNSIREAERSLSVHAWQLRQLVPPAPEEPSRKPAPGAA
jgi:serine/threonine protein kinase